MVGINSYRSQSICSSTFCIYCPTTALFCLLLESTQIFGTAPPGVRKICALLFSFNASLNLPCVSIWRNSSNRCERLSFTRRFASLYPLASISSASALPFALSRKAFASSLAFCASLLASSTPSMRVFTCSGKTISRN